MSNYSPVILSLQQEILTISAANIYIYMDLAKLWERKSHYRHKNKCIYTTKTSILTRSKGNITYLNYVSLNHIAKVLYFSHTAAICDE